MSYEKSAGRKNHCSNRCETDPSECPLWDFTNMSELYFLDDVQVEVAKKFACGAVRRALDHVENYYSRDQLTGLYNRAYMLSHLSSRIDYLLAEFNIEHSPVSGIQLAFIDLDGFKAVNDGLGHSAGDDVLRIVADKLRTVTRDHDMVVRWGGDEFIVIAPYIPRDDTYSSDNTQEESLGDRLVSAVTFEYSQGYPVSASVGVTYATGIDRGLINGNVIEAMIHHADKEMYKAKVAGKGRSCESFISLS